MTGCQAVIRVGTGQDDGPVSTNATLGSNGAFSKSQPLSRPRLDRLQAHTDFLVEPAGHPTRSPRPTSCSTTDLGFDGASAKYGHDIIPGLHASGTAGAFPLFNTDFAFATNNPNKFASTDSYLFAGQAGADYSFRSDLMATWPSASSISWAFRAR